MFIIFKRDFRGVNTGEQFYQAGEIADLPNGAAIVAEGAAEVYTVEARKGQVKLAEMGIVDDGSRQALEETTLKKTGAGMLELPAEQPKTRGRKP